SDGEESNYWSHWNYNNEIVSRTNKMTIQFQFYFGCNKRRLRFVWRKTSECAFHYQQNGGLIQYPVEDFYFSKSKTCIWTISLPIGNFIELDFWNFDVGPTDQILIK
ncbi:unnamed protein product, partial [Meganyctiphanes norvegica]